MKNSDLDIPILCVWPLGLFTVYVAAYLLSTELYAGRIGQDRYLIRLFRSELHYGIFQPLIATEARLRPAQPAFSGQVQTGASLPPPERP